MVTSSNQKQSFKFWLRNGKSQSSSGDLVTSIGEKSVVLDHLFQCICFNSGHSIQDLKPDQFSLGHMPPLSKVIQGTLPDYPPQKEIKVLLTKEQETECCMARTVLSTPLAYLISLKYSYFNCQNLL